MGLLHAVGGGHPGTGTVGRREENHRTDGRRFRVLRHQGRVQESEGRTSQGQGSRDLWRSQLTRATDQNGQTSDAFVQPIYRWSGHFLYTALSSF